MKQKSLFAEFPDAEIPENFRSEEGIEKFYGFPKTIMVKVEAFTPEPNPEGNPRVRPNQYQKNPLWKALKAEHPNLIVACTAQEVILQLKIFVYAIYDIDETTARYQSDFIHFRSTPEHWATLTRRYERIPA